MMRSRTPSIVSIENFIKVREDVMNMKETAYRIAPAGCYINHLPIRGNLPTIGKTKD